MSRILLPELKLTYFTRPGSKNKIEQVVAKEISADYFFSQSFRSYVVILIDGISYCITSNKNLELEFYDYILLSNKKPTERSLANREIILKSWIKHPLKREFNTVEIKTSCTIILILLKKIFKYKVRV